MDWNKVKTLIENILSDTNCEIIIYEPNAKIKEVINKERTKLTPARAMLLSVLFDLVKSGEFVSEFAAEKAAYFLQRFGAKDEFKLKYKPYFYGPYSGKIRHVLYYLNGSYITGYTSKDKKPFEELGLIADTEKIIENYLDKPENIKHKSTFEKTKAFLKGYYSSFGLELLSSIDFIMQDKKINKVHEIEKELKNWSNRKKTLFSNRKFITKAVENLNKHLYS